MKLEVRKARAAAVAANLAAQAAVAARELLAEALGRHPRDPYQPQQLGRGHARALRL